MLRATLKSLLARKLRLVLSGLAVVLGVMFVSGTFVLTDTLNRTFDSLFSDVYSATDVSVSAKPKVEVSEFEGEQVAAPLPAAAIDKIKSQAGVRAAVGRIDVDGARVIGSDGKVLTSMGPPRLGANWTGVDAVMDMREGRGPEAPGEIAVNATTAELAGYRIGDSVPVLTQQPKREFTLVGIWGYSGDRDSIGGTQEVAFTTPVAQELMLGEKDVFTSVTVEAADGVSPAQLRDQLAPALGADYVVKTGDDLAEDSSASIKEGLGFFNQILLGFAGIALFVGIFIILNTFSIVVAQRTRELALLRAIGASRRQVINSVLVEAVVVGLIASVLGLAAGVGAGAGLASLFSSLGGGGLDLAPVGVPPAAIISSFLVGLVVTVVAAVMPALRASRIAPVAAMQDVATPDRPLTRISVAGTVVTAAGAAALGVGLFTDAGDADLWLIFGGVLVTFVGVALLTPLISRPVVSLLGRLFSWSVPGRLGRLNSGRNPRRTAITAAALMVGIALVTGVTVVMDSAKSSLKTEAASILKSQIMISGDQNGPRPPTFDPAVIQKTDQIPGVRAAAAMYNDLVAVGGDQEYVTATEDLAILGQAYGTTAATLRDDQIAVSGPQATDSGWQVGSTVTIQASRGEQHTYTVSSIFAENTLPGSIIMPGAAIKDFGITQPTFGFVRLDDGVPVSAVLPQVKALLADSPEVSATDQETWVNAQAAQFDQIITMIQILLGLAILIAVLGVINTLALSVLERTRELGLLRAVGLGRAQTMRMVTVEAVVISVFGALLGVAVGAGMGSAVARALEDDGISQIVLPWGRMGTYLGLAALVGVVAAVAPAIRAARLNILNAIAHD
ncbi:putative ABC transport system permease protein [Actinoplanes lutulentus]|uniref:Putative ABC transport system permease protein n=1 Tax=Actinoplanes lutulentus TaxID=1287878 RepID=A0A327ZNE9_9ACTN|nr:ABC transporter permease [Actinoplanes lutulentus]MBB2944023.1 putative ABC transport system permease protein [Actinoplanes lutulentus]RAK42744.1 putative ABC transport system permease protein [Actinoplanes lutulentus]